MVTVRPSDAAGPSHVRYALPDSVSIAGEWCAGLCDMAGDCSQQKGASDTTQKQSACTQITPEKWTSIIGQTLPKFHAALVLDEHATQAS